MNFSLVGTFSGATRSAIIGKIPMSMMWMRDAEHQLRFNKGSPVPS